MDMLRPVDSLEHPTPHFAKAASSPCQVCKASWLPAGCRDQTLPAQRCPAGTEVSQTWSITDAQSATLGAQSRGLPHQ